MIRGRKQCRRVEITSIFLKTYIIFVTQINPFIMDLRLNGEASIQMATVAISVN